MIAAIYLHAFRLGQLGLALNFLGTVAVAFSFGKNPLGSYQSGGPLGEKKVYLASFKYPRLFRVGLALIALGFVLQLVDF